MLRSQNIQKCCSNDSIGAVDSGYASLDGEGVTALT